MSNIDKRLVRCISANDLVDLKAYEGRVFKMVRYNELTIVRLTKVKRRDVYLERLQDNREDGFTMTHAEFRKWYHMAPSNTADAKQVSSEF